MQAFDALAPPFDRLSHDEAERLRQHADVGYFRPGERVVTQGRTSGFLHVLLKGTVEVRNGDGLLAVVRAGDTFDARAVVHGEAGEDFIAAEETLCVLLPRDDIIALVHSNAAFGAFFYAEVSQKLDALSARPGGDIADSVLSARVRDCRHAPAVFVDGSATMGATGRAMLDAGVDAAFVRDGERIGIVTGLKLTRALVIEGRPIETHVREIARFEVVSIEAEDRLADALLTMTRHNKRGIAVKDGDRFVGLLRDIDILGRFAGNSQLMPGRIARASCVDDLASVASDIAEQVELLYRQGVRADAIAEITSDLNHRLHARIFDLLAPASFRDASCLFLMGSEGRGEQIVRTDQDNGLLLTSAAPASDLDAFRFAFTAALERCGFPACPGNIMVRNPAWSRTLDSFLEQLRQWAFAGTPEAAMNIAIFADAAPAAGDFGLLSQAKAVLVDILRGETRLLAQLATLVNLAKNPGTGLLGTMLTSLRLRHDRIDLKREGIFPIVHGTRVLALEHGALAGSTSRRIKALAEHGALDARFGQELAGALQVFTSLRLRAQLEGAYRGNDNGSALDLGALTAIERDVLRDASRVVARFRELIGLRYGLASL